MILFEDWSKAKTVNVNKLLGDKVFNKIHLIFDTNGYNIYNLTGNAPYVISYCDRLLYYKLLRSICSYENSEQLKQEMNIYYKLNKDRTINALKSYVSRNNSPETHFNKPLCTLLCKCNSKIRFNKLERPMFQDTNVERGIQFINVAITQLYNYLYDNNVIIKEFDDNINYLLALSNRDNYKNELFIFTPRSYLRNQISIDEVELMISLIDRIEKRGGYFILIDELSIEMKQNLILETVAKINKRRCTIVDNDKTKIMVLTNIGG